MGRINDYFIRHVWAPIVLGVIVASAVTWVLFGGNPVATVVRACLYSAAGVGFMLSRRRKEQRAAGGSMDRLVRVEQRLRAGETPSDPDDRRIMREIVERRLHQTRHRVPALVFLALLFAAVTVLTGLTASPWRTVGLAVFGVVFLGWMIWNSNRQTHRLRTMRDALRGGDPAPAAGPADNPPVHPAA
ncbi:hypothetical protein ACIPPM_21345 [Streptomyces sp. NPDC090119]|uniref:hypothetical protein n=1 Tax=Streptomyces sp. NPDC090119 TaxID=3365951 RepID=UPI0038002382